MKEEEQNFQTMNMIYKIKKIKKRKKIDNIQNIELFKTLDNVIENEEDKDSKQKTDNIKEPFRDLNDDDWEGLDDVKSDIFKASVGFLDNIVDFLNYLYVSIITANCYSAFIFVNSSKNNDDPDKVPNSDITWDYITSIIMIDKDNSLLHEIDNNNPINGGNKGLSDDTIKDSNKVFNYLCLFEAAIATYIFSYMWFYIIFYSYVNKIDNVTFFDNLTHDNLANNSNIFVSIIFFFFEYAIIIFDTFRWFLLENLPVLCNNLQFNNVACFLLLFAMIFIVNYKYLAYIKNFLIDLLNINYKNIVIILLLIYVFGKYILTFSPNKKQDSDKPDLPQNLQLLTDSAGKFFEMASKGYYGIFIAIINVLKEILRVISIFTLGLPFGVILCVLYFLWVSIFVNFSYIFNVEIRERIINFIRQDLIDVNKMGDCSMTTTIWEKIMDSVKNIFLYLSLFIFNYLPFIIIMVFSIYVLIDHILNIKGLGVINNIQKNITLLILIVCMQLYTVVKQYIQTATDEKDNINYFYIFILPSFNLLLNYLNSSYMSMFYFFIVILLLSFIISLMGKSENDIKNMILDRIYHFYK